MTDLIIVGSSAGDPSPIRATAGLLIKVGARFYQFDAGEGFSSSIKRLKINHSKIAAIMISHMHADHVAGLFLELQMMYLAGRSEPLPIYLPAEGLKAVEIFLRAAYLFEEKIGFKIPLKSVMPDPVFRDDNITVYARLNTHLNKYESIIEKGNYPNRMQSYTYLIKTKNRKIIYSGDIGSANDYADLLAGCDLLVTEGMHADMEQLFESVAANGIPHLVLVHLSEDVFGNPKHLKDMARKSGVPDLQIAYDGLSLKF